MKRIEACDRNGQRNRGQGRTGWHRRWSFLVFVVLLVSGCGLGKNKPYVVKQYLLEYPPPAVEGLKPGNEPITVKHFFVGKAFSTTEMVYRQDPYLYQSDPYNQWMVSPGLMVSGYLTRDLTRSGIFRAVFASDSVEPTRYVLQGRVDEFLESNQDGISKAVLGLSVILLDATRGAVPGSVVFQRDYRILEPLPEKTSVAFAQAMSKAMEQFSRLLLADLSKVINESKP